MSFLDTVEGEIALFRAVGQARPLGINRHFHLLAIRNMIHAETGKSIPIDEIWAKLGTCYDLDALEALTTEAEAYSNDSTPKRIPSPPAEGNLSGHPYFREEFALPSDPTIDEMITTRRARNTPSLPSNTPPPPSSPAPIILKRTSKARAGSKRGKSKLDMAGLVAGDSDSSALTQESGDEDAPTPRDSVMTGTDAGTDYADDDNPDMAEDSPAPSTAMKTVGRGKKGKKPAKGKATAATNATVPKPSKKKKK